MPFTSKRERSNACVVAIVFLSVYSVHHTSSADSQGMKTLNVSSLESQGRAFASPQRGQAAHSNGQVQGPARDQVDGFQSRGPYSSVPGQQGAPGQRSARQHGSWGAARGEGESARGSSHRQGPTRGKRHSYAAPY